MNILNLGKRGGRTLLEQACRQLTDEDPYRQITIPAVSTASPHCAPNTMPAPPPAASPPSVASGRPSGRDTSRAHLVGAGTFSLDALTRPATACDDTVGGAHDA